MDNKTIILDPERKIKALVFPDSHPSMAELYRDHARYEYVRKLNPRQFAKLYLQNLDGHGTFDDIVDRAIEGQKARKTT